MITPLRHVLCTIAVVMASLSALAEAAAPAGRYTTTPETVFDTKTQLMWQRTTPSTPYTWIAAKSYCSGADVGALLGGKGRLPTIKELQTIIDYSQSSGPTIDSIAFPGTPSGGFWSSSLGGGTGAWDLNFADGDTNANDMSAMDHVRCVH